MGPVNKHPPTTLPKGSSQAGGWREYVRASAHSCQKSCTHIHTRVRTHACILAHAPYVQLQLWTHRVYAQVYTPAHTDPRRRQPRVPGTHLPTKSPARAQEHSSRRQVPHSHLTLVISWVGQSFAAHGHGLSPPQPPCEDGQLG